MKCPVCTTMDLVMTDRQGVEIDYCPQCRGVWLDRGELDKIIERTGLQAQSQPQPQPQPQRQAEHVTRQPYHDHHDHDYYKKKKHKSLLGDLFDF